MRDLLYVNRCFAWMRMLGVLCMAAPLLAQQPAPPLRWPKGQVVERVVAGSDTSKSYALYVPTGYTPGSPRPVLLVLDPRGRALLALDLFRGAAERYGYIVLSSYNTMSDDPKAPNDEAVNAMLVDAQQNFSMDMRRLYLSGFSGTARLVWKYASLLRENTAGIIGFGAGLRNTATLLELRLTGAPPSFGFYGGAGTTDFNYDEVRHLDAQLDSFGIRHHVEYFDGPHSWPPKAICEAALDWMELQAMRDGRRPRSNAFIDSLYSRDVEAARALEAAGNAPDALLHYRAVVADFDGLHDVSGPKARVAELERSKEVRAANKKVEKLEAQFNKYDDKLASFIQEFEKSRELPPLKKFLDELDIRSLQRDAERTDDPTGARGAARILAHTFAITSFYQPRQYLQQGDTVRALAMLEMAYAIKPRDSGVCYSRARVFARRGQTQPALEALRCALADSASAGRFREAAQRDSALASLRGEPGFRQLVDSAGAKATPNE